MKFLCKGFGKHTLCLALTGLFISLAFPVLSETPEEFVPPCFTGSELEKVREWEKTWVGKKVSMANVDQVKDLLPETLVQMMKESTKWGTNELWFEIVPYSYCAPSKGMLEATKKYSPFSKFEPKGFKTPWGEVAPNELLAGYVEGEIAGYPFPRPKTGLEMAWNFDANTYGDTHQKSIFGLVVNCRTGTERIAHQPDTHMFWTGRTALSPIPRIEKNPRGLRHSYFLSVIEPVDMYGSNHITLIYTDPRKENDTYIWVAMYRRVRRLSTNQRGDTIDGTDCAFSDGFNYSDQINRNTYKFLEVKDMLAIRHQDASKLKRVKGQGLFNGQQRERCKLYLIEVINKDPDRVYSKEVWYLDGETWQMPYKLIWDRQGRSWRFLDEQIGYLMSIQGNAVAFPVAYNFVDIQRLHGCPSLHKDPKLGIEVGTDMFTLQYLQKTGY